MEYIWLCCNTINYRLNAIEIRSFQISLVRFSIIFFFWFVSIGFCLYRSFYSIQIKSIVKKSWTDGEHKLCTIIASIFLSYFQSSLKNSFFIPGLQLPQESSLGKMKARESVRTGNSYDTEQNLQYYKQTANDTIRLNWKDQKAVPC